MQQTAETARCCHALEAILASCTATLSKRTFGTGFQRLKNNSQGDFERTLNFQKNFMMRNFENQFEFHSQQICFASIDIFFPKNFRPNFCSKILLAQKGQQIFLASSHNLHGRSSGPHMRHDAPRLSQMESSVPMQFWVHSCTSEFRKTSRKKIHKSTICNCMAKWDVGTSEELWPMCVWSVRQALSFPPRANVTWFMFCFPRI